MTTPVETNLLMMNSSATTYTVGNSLRFRSSASAYLNRNQTVLSSRTTFTYSAWIKRGTISSGAFRLLVAQLPPPPYSFDSQYMSLIINSSDNLIFGIQSYNVLVSSAVYRDPSAWYHVILSVDSTQATASNRQKLYVNGEQITSFSTNTPVPLNQPFAINTASTNLQIGSDTYNSSYTDGYFSEVNFIDGQALTPSSFGAYDSTTGVWQPKKYTGTYGTNGFYLPFSNNSSVSNLGLDFSGNGNNWTPNNFSLTAGYTYDSVIDSPTVTTTATRPLGNYCVINPLSKNPTVQSLTLTSGNLQSQGTIANCMSKGTFAIPTTGKYYFEGYSAGTSTLLGFCENNADTFGNNSSTVGARVWYLYQGGVNVYTITPAAVTPQTASGTGTMVCAVDFASSKLWLGWAVNSVSIVWYGGGDPALGTSPTATLAGDVTQIFPIMGTNGTNMTVNFGQQPFTFTPPAGFKSLCTSNLPTPSIVNGATAMAATLYTGTGAVANINNGTNTTLGTTFQPDLVWIKSRSNATNNCLFNSVQGTGLYLVSNNTNGIITDANTLTSFASNGFALGSDASSAGVNISGNTYVGWSWKGGGAAVTNTAGSITSQVSANPTAGISVVTFTTTGSTATVGHGLGAVPKMIIVKQPVNASVWPVYHVSTGATNRLVLNDTSAATADTSWGNTTPTSTVFTQNITAAIRTPVAICFAEVPGFSAFGSYTGNGSTSGPFIYLGFRPRWIMIKSSSNASSWIIWDTSRNTYNVVNLNLFANLSSSEFTGIACDILSNGFKLRDNGTNGYNSSGFAYIYAAFAENPFKYSLAR